jgi:regulator of sigma D
MLVATKINLPILISNYIFPNSEGLERVDKFVPNMKSSNEKILNFQDTQKEDVQIVAPFKHKKFQS